MSDSELVVPLAPWIDERRNAYVSRVVDRASHVSKYRLAKSVRATTDVVADFAERTRRNLRAVESLQGEGREVFEVTQLINSMLGLLVFPRSKEQKKATV